MTPAEINAATIALVAISSDPDPIARVGEIERLAMSGEHDARTVVLAATICMRALAASLASVTGGGRDPSDAEVDSRLAWLLDAVARS